VFADNETPEGLLLEFDERGIIPEIHPEDKSIAEQVEYWSDYGMELCRCVPTNKSINSSLGKIGMKIRTLNNLKQEIDEMIDNLGPLFHDAVRLSSFSSPPSTSDTKQEDSAPQKKGKQTKRKK